MAALLTGTRLQPIHANSESKREGRLWNIDGVQYYSPNCIREPKVPKEGSIPVFIKGVSTIDDFQNPFWWCDSTEWLAFVPRKPVVWSGVIFETLALLPAVFPRVEGRGYIMPYIIQAHWRALEKFLVKCISELQQRYHLRPVLPFLPEEMDYQGAYPTPEEARNRTVVARDWFALLVGVLYWMTCSIPNRPNFVKGINTPEWYATLVVLLRDQCALDGLRCCTLLQDFWDISHVGVFLKNPDEDRNQPSAWKFIEHNIPVWYKWGESEERASRYNPNYALPRPSNEEITNITYVNTAVDKDSDVAQYDVSHLDFNDGGGQDFNFEPSNFETPSSFQENITSGIVKGIRKSERELAILAKSFWEPWLKGTEEQCKEMGSRENASTLQSRKARERNPPTSNSSKCKVFYWDWDDHNEQKVYRRIQVRKDDKEDTLSHYSASQKFYNAFTNEWDCCLEWGKDLDDEDEGMIQYNIGFMANPGMQSSSLEELLTRQQVEDEGMRRGPQMSDQGGERGCDGVCPSPDDILSLLHLYFGFERTEIPVAASTNITEGDKMKFACLLGLNDVLKPSSAFFDDVWAKAGVDFLRCFWSKEETKPTLEIWDLHDASGRKFCPWLSSIRMVQWEGKLMLYMFDLAGEATVPWHLAVYTASAALVVSRLGEMPERAMVRELLKEGIPFRTVQERSTLIYIKEGPPASLLPMRLSDYKFSEKDYNIYVRQRECTLLSRRGRAALLRGGVSWRLAKEHVAISSAMDGPSGQYHDKDKMFIVKDSRGVEFVDDDLTEMEMAMVCGVYIKKTGNGSQDSEVSWFPKQGQPKTNGEDVGHWTNHAEHWYTNRVRNIKAGSCEYGMPRTSGKWKQDIRPYPSVRETTRKLERWSKVFVMSI